MESAGDEKRIRALFSELSVQDRKAAPRFDTLWATAHTAPVAVRGFGKPLLAIVFVVMLIAVSVVAWSWQPSVQPTKQEAVNVAPQQASSPSAPAVQQQANNTAPHAPALQPRTNSHPARHAKVARLRRIDRTTITEANVLSQWQSPTQLYLQSPVTVDFSSLPQLNQSAEELKQFLPRNTDQMKESKQ